MILNCRCHQTACICAGLPSFSASSSSSAREQMLERALWRLRAALPSGEMFQHLRDIADEALGVVIVESAHSRR